MTLIQKRNKYRELNRSNDYKKRREARDLEKANQLLCATGGIISKEDSNYKGEPWEIVMVGSFTEIKAYLRKLRGLEHIRRISSDYLCANEYEIADINYLQDDGRIFPYEMAPISFGL
jgi:hypothetical protein